MRRSVLFLSAACFALAAAAYAEPRLIATASLDSHGHDLSPETADPLENGVAGNLLGGMGSGLDYAGGDTFIAMPDRGPNANTYNAAVDNTSSYIPRFHTLTAKLIPSSGPLPFTLEPKLTATTLMWSPDALVYGDGKAATLPDGAPKLNAAHHSYFTGRSDGFDPKKPSTDPLDARLDPEGLRLSSDGKSVFVSDEYGPHLYQFDRATGRRLRAVTLPANLDVAVPAAREADEIAANIQGREANKGMEGLAITPDGSTLIGFMQTASLQDGGAKGGFNRIVRIDILTGASHEYAYPLTNVGKDGKIKFTGVSEVLAINDHEILVDERDGKGLGDGSAAVFKRLYRVDLSKAEPVDTLAGADVLAPKAVSKTLAFDLVAILTKANVDPASIPAKIEGVAFGPDVTLDGKTLHTLWVVNDNDFLPDVDGRDNPNRIFVIGFDDADLPGLHKAR
jgi:hypothetical protein